MKKEQEVNQVCWLFRSTDNLVTILGYISVSVATIIAFRQWKQEQVWKRKETLMFRITSFNDTPGARNAMLMLESSDRDIPIWDKEKPECRYTRIRRRQVALALLPERLLPLKYSPLETAIRDSFEDFFGRISHLEQYWRSKLLMDDEVKILINAWVNAIKALMSSSNQMDIALKRHLFLYMHEKKIDHVISMFKHFEIDIESNINQDEINTKKEIAEDKWQRTES